MKKFCALLFVLCASLVHATSVTGTINFEGSPLNGYMTIQLAYPATNGTHLNLNGGTSPVMHPVVNGTFTTLTVDGNDTMLPRQTFYMVTYYDSYSQPILRAPYVITGSSFDLGQAVPTPITTANVNFLDLLGLRNMSVQNLTVGNSMQFGTGLLLGVTGVSNAQYVNSIAFAQYFETGSTTCGLQEAYNALPSYGGWIVAPPGACTMVSTLTISKPIKLTGYGSGSVADNINASTYFAGTQLINGTVSSNSINISLTFSQQVLGGVSISDLALIGNKTVVSASTGSGVSIVGGTTTASDLHDISLNNLFIYGFKEDGIKITDKVTRVNISNVQSVYNFRAGLEALQTQGIVGASDVRIDHSNFSNNSDKNIWYASTTGNAGELSIFQSTIGKASTIGIFIDSGSGARLTLSHSVLDTNGTYEVSLVGGIGHVLENNVSIPPHFDDANTIGATTSLTSATANFTPFMVGQPVVIAGAGPAGANLSTTIFAYTNSTTVILATNASLSKVNTRLFINPPGYGIYVDPFIATPSGVVSAVLRENDVEGHTTCDYASAVSALHVIFYDQIKAPGANGVSACWGGTTYYPTLTHVP
jgi:hypothetical protein